jgi:hypothetical protein
MAWRVLDRFKKGASLPWLLGLGLAATAFNVGFEVVWLYFYRGRALLRTLTSEFTVTTDFFNPFPATYQLLILALAVPLLVATLARPARAGWFRLRPIAASDKRQAVRA